MPDSPILCFGPYQLDLKQEQFWSDGQPVRLPPKVFQVLRYLAERPGQLVTKEELFRVVWADTVVGDAALTMCIQELRKALADNAREPQYIETVPRRGFRFLPVVTTQPVQGSRFKVQSQEAEENQKSKACPELSRRGKSQKSKVEEAETEADTEKTEAEDAGRRTPDVGLFPQSSATSTQAVSFPPPRWWASKMVIVTAYDFYLRGIASSLRVGFETKKEENAHARQMFAKAVELDPTYAEAYVGLSRTYFDDWFFQWANDRTQALEQAREIAEQARALDDSLPGAHRILALVYAWKRQYEQAIAEIQQAIALDPNDPDGYGRLGGILIFTGQPEEAIGVIEKAMRLNPRYAFFYLNNLGLAHLAAGRYEEAIAPLQRLLVRNPNMMIAYVNIAICYVELGRLEEARAAGAEVMRLNPHWSLDFIRQAPWKDPAIIERHVAALHKAGLK